MAPQIETPKGLLSRQATLPKLALANTPLSPLGEGLSGILSSVAQSLPDAPAPALPGAGAALGAPRLPRLGLAGVFKGIEATLPAGVPQLSQVVSGFESAAAGGGNSPEAGPVIGGGFRSVAGKQVKILGGGYRSI